MKIITLIPVRNEDWILDFTLKNISEFSDSIIVADQHSTDNTLSICARYPKVQIIKNDGVGHSNKVRWLLLDAARKTEGNNLIFCIDADEIISKESAEMIKTEAMRHDTEKKVQKDSLAFSLPWIQLWKGVEKHRIDGVWRNNNKPAAFYDNRIIQYKKEEVINDHTSRIPDSEAMPIKFMRDCPLLHFQFAAWNRTQIKQAWYRCSELIKNPRGAKHINHKYSITLDSASVKTETVPKAWLASISLQSELQSEMSSSSLFQKINDAQLSEIKQWFREYGIVFFESLQIWHIPELHKIFMNEMKREPKTQTYHPLLITLNGLKNRLKNMLRQGHEGGVIVKKNKI